MHASLKKDQNRAGILQGEERQPYLRDIQPFPGVQKFLKKVKKRLVSP